jgi:hypothetical protein
MPSPRAIMAWLNWQRWRACIPRTWRGPSADAATFRQELIQGDVRAALRTTQTLPAKDAAALACIRQRFAIVVTAAGAPSLLVQMVW